MTVGLVVGNYVVANVLINRAYLRSLLGAYELVIPLDVTPTPVREKAWWVCPHALRIKLKGDGNRDLGIARPDRIDRFHQNSGAYPRTFWFSVQLSPHQVAALEDERDGRDLSFSFTLHGDGGDDAAIREAFQTEINLTIPQSQWIEQLRSASVLNIMLLEVPMPVGQLSGTQVLAAKYLRQAQLHFAQGNYGDAVGDCRMALEQLGIAPKALDLFASGRNSMTKAERGRAMLAAARHFTHLAHHTSTEMYSRGEAKLILQITAAYAAADPFVEPEPP